MDDDILDINADDIVVRETQIDQISPETFSRKMIQRFGIRQHNNGPEAINNTQNDNVASYTIFNYNNTYDIFLLLLYSRMLIIC